MTTRNEYLRRALLAPLLVPLLAAIHLLKDFPSAESLNTNTYPETGWGVFCYWLILFLLWSLGIGGVPYLWMLHDKRKNFCNQKRGRTRWDFNDHHSKRKLGFRYASDDELDRLWWSLPMEMMPYFYKFWAVLTVCLIPTIYGIYVGIGALVVGTVAVPILGYLYVGITFGSLSLFRWLGLVK